MEYLTDERDLDAHLLHLPSGVHRVIPAQGVGRNDSLAQARVEVLGIAVRLQDIADDLARVMAYLDRAE